MKDEILVATTEMFECLDPKVIVAGILCRIVPLNIS